MGMLCRVNVALIYRGRKKGFERGERTRKRSRSNERATFTCGASFFLRSADFACFRDSKHLLGSTANPRKYCSSSNGL